VLRTAIASSYGARHIGNGDDSAVFRLFVPGDLDFRPLTLALKLGRNFCTVYIAAKFDRPTFNRSEVIMRTNKQTNALKTCTALQYSTMLGWWVNIEQE